MNKREKQKLIREQLHDALDELTYVEEYKRKHFLCHALVYAKRNEAWALVCELYQTDGIASAETILGVGRYNPPWWLQDCSQPVYDKQEARILALLFALEVNRTGL